MKDQAWFKAERDRRMTSTASVEVTQAEAAALSAFTVAGECHGVPWHVSSSVVQFDGLRHGVPQNVAVDFAGLKAPPRARKM